MRRLVVGTAGHIDHGKTKLIEALTGIDCDRWAEEKARGITIDLGFAHLTEGDLQVGFVDVPGHERFVHNALAGLGGIRLMLLVVAADEGAKPQTREHLAICSLLGIPGALVALTKADLASPDVREVAELEAAELLEGTPFAGAPILPVSVVTGEGLGELRARLLERAGELALPAETPDEPARLPVDRAFHLKGLGVVVTGTLAAGSVRPGDELEVLPGGERARVRGVQVHGDDREAAVRGERAALQLAGVELAALGRGDQLVEPGAYAPTRRLAVRLTWLPEAPRPLRGWTDVRLHLLSSEAAARVRPLEPATLEPGTTGLAELRLAAPVVAVPGDRLVLRRPSPPLTLGGGETLDPAWVPARGRRRRAAAAALGEGKEALLAAWVERAGPRGTTTADLARRLGRRPEGVREDLAALAADGRLLELGDAGGGGRWVAAGPFEELAARARRLLEEHFREQRLSSGIPRADFLSRLLGPEGSPAADALVERLAAAGAIRADGPRITLPDRSGELAGEDSQLARRLVERYEAAGLEPPAPAAVAAELGAKPQIVEGVVGHLVERGRLVRLPSGLVLAAATVERVRAGLEEAGWDRFTVGQFKELFGVTRKWAIPLLEYLDSIGATRRVGDQRQIARRSQPATERRSP